MARLKHEECVCTLRQIRPRGDKLCEGGGAVVSKIIIYPSKDVCVCSPLLPILAQKIIASFSSVFFM